MAKVRETPAQKALKARRSAAAKYGWEMRRFRDNLAARPLSAGSVHFAPISPQSRKSILSAARSAAAKKGWATRRLRRSCAQILKLTDSSWADIQAHTLGGQHLPAQSLWGRIPGYERFDGRHDPDALNPREVSDYLAKHGPNPWLRIAAQVRDWWLRATGWLR